jgi:hypothetical protein
MENHRLQPRESVSSYLSWWFLPSCLHTGYGRPRRIVNYFFQIFSLFF